MGSSVRAHQETKSTNSFRFSKAITMAMIQAKAESQRGAFISPILSASAVNITSGKTAKDSWRLSTTWVKIRSWAVPLSPKAIVTPAAGMMAIPG